MQFDDLSHKSSGSSLNQSQSTASNNKTATSSTENLSSTESTRRNTIATVPPVKPPRNDHKPQDEWESKLFGKQPKCIALFYFNPIRM